MNHDVDSAIRNEALEEAAKVADKAAKEYQDRLDAGKGKWPKQNYVRDETWARWRGSVVEARRIASAIRSLKSHPAAQVKMDVEAIAQEIVFTNSDKSDPYPSVDAEEATANLEELERVTAILHRHLGAGERGGRG